MFNNYISKLPTFIPDIDNPVAQHANYCPQSITMTTYATALKSKTTNSIQNTTNQDSKCFNKPPKTYQPQTLDFNLNPSEFTNILTNKTTVTPTTTTNQTSKNTTTPPQMTATPKCTQHMKQPQPPPISTLKQSSATFYRIFMAISTSTYNNKFRKKWQASSQIYLVSKTYIANTMTPTNALPTCKTNLTPFSNTCHPSLSGVA